MLTHVVAVFFTINVKIAWNNKCLIKYCVFGYGIFLEIMLVSTNLLPKMCSIIRSVIYAADGEGKRDITDRCEWLWGMHPFTPFAFSENNRFVIVIIDLCSHRSCCRRYCHSSWLATVLSTSPENSKIWTPHRNWKTSRFMCCAQFQPPPEHQTSKFACVNIVWDVKHYDDNENFPAWLMNDRCYRQ